MNILNIFKRKKKDFECYGRYMIYRSFVDNHDLDTCLRSIDDGVDRMSINIRDFLKNSVREYKGRKT